MLLGHRRRAHVVGEAPRAHRAVHATRQGTAHAHRPDLGLAAVEHLDARRAHTTHDASRRSTVTPPRYRAIVSSLPSPADLKEPPRAYARCSGGVRADAAVHDLTVDRHHPLTRAGAGGHERSHRPAATLDPD